MSNGDHRDRFFYSTLSLMIDSYNTNFRDRNMSYLRYSNLRFVKIYNGQPHLYCINVHGILHQCKKGYYIMCCFFSTIVFGFVFVSLTLVESHIVLSFYSLVYSCFISENLCQFYAHNNQGRHFSNQGRYLNIYTRPRSAVGSESHCRSRSCEFDSSLVPYFPGY